MSGESSIEPIHTLPSAVARLTYVVKGGSQNLAQRVKDGWDIGLDKAKGEWTNLEKASFSPSEELLIHESEERIHQYFRDKFIKLGLDPQLFPQFAPITYIKSDQISPAGVRLELFNMTIVQLDRETDDILGTMVVVAHEVSHESAIARAKMYVDINESYMDHPLTLEEIANNIKKVSLDMAVGLDRGVGEKRIGAAIENGLAIMDEVDMYFLYLQNIFPDQAHMRRSLIESGKFDDELEHLPQGIYKPSLEELDPFVLVPENNNSKSHLFKLILDNYLFIKELCRTIGMHDEIIHNANLSARGNTEDVEKQRQEGYIAKGREILEKSRYTGNKDANKMLLKIFGKDILRLILEADDTSKDNEYKLIRAMRFVKDKQWELEMSTSREQ